MYVDPIVEEIHHIRKQHCQHFGFDLHKIFADVKQREQQSQHKVVNFSLEHKREPNNAFAADFEKGAEEK